MILNVIIMNLFVSLTDNEEMKKHEILPIVQHNYCGRDQLFSF